MEPQVSGEAAAITPTLRVRITQPALGAAFAAYAAGYLLLAQLAQIRTGSVLPLVLAYLFLPFLTVALLGRAWSHAQGPQRQSWMLLTLSLSGLVLGDTIWSAYQFSVDAGGPTLDSIAGAVYALAYIPLVALVVVVLRRTLGTVPALTRIRILLEIVIATIVLSSSAIAFVTAPIHRAMSHPLNAAPLLVSSLFCVLDVFVVTSLAAIALESGNDIWRRWEGKVIVALGIVAVAQLVSSYAETANLYRIGTLPAAGIDLMWLAAYALMAMAAIQRLTLPRDLPSVLAIRMVHRRGLRWYDFAMPGVVLLLSPLALFEARYGSIPDTGFWVLAISALLVVALVMFRSVILTAENGALMTHSVIDPLTGAYNHRYFHERLGIEVDRARRSGERLAVALLDVDDFGQVNANFGHSAGDATLRALSQVLRRHERPAETLCRLGSDEFGLIMPLTGAHEAAERIAEMLEELPSHPELAEKVRSASVGIACFPKHATDKTDLFRKADGALYWAQSSGRGDIVVYDEGVVEAFSPEERIRIAEEQSYMQTVESLAAAVDARDSYTQGHSRNVSLLASAVALRLGFSASHAKLIGIAGLLHDVGKIGVPDHILRKTSALTEEERLTIQQHPVLGERILSATIFKEILPWVLGHHERWDGQGYPNGTAGEENPIEARILAVCDAFDAMVSDRPYRQGMSVDDALDELRRGASRQFDPLVVGAFIDMEVADGLPVGLLQRV